tara:strand:+ start:274 stop:408 length:135 start_codon:yes stop_codon:yes gene_type:complete
MNKKEWLWMDSRITCEFCAKTMTEEEHDFCDICPDCRDENPDGF